MKRNYALPTGGFIAAALLAALLGACNNFFHDLVPPDGDRITSFKVPGQVRAAVISDNAISVTVQEGTHIRGLLPEIAVSPKAKVLPVTFNYIQTAFPSADILSLAMGLYSSDNPQTYIEGLIRSHKDFNIPRFDLPIDFSAPVDLYVISARGGMRKYTVYITEENASDNGSENGSEWPKILGMRFSKADNPGLSKDALCWVFEDSRTISAAAKYPPESDFSYALAPSFVIQGDCLELDGEELVSGQSVIQFDTDSERQTRVFTVWRDGVSANYTLNITFSEDSGADGPMLAGLRFAKYDNPELVIDAVCRINESGQTVSAKAFYPVEMLSLSYALIPSFDIFGERLIADGRDIISGESLIQFDKVLGTQDKVFTVWRNGESKDYILSITFEEDPDTVRSITDFRFVKSDNPNIAANAVASIINTENTGAISVQVFYSGAEPSALIPRFVSPGTVSVLGATQTTGASSQDFSSVIEYRVISRNGQYTRTYTVKSEFISLADAAPKITLFRFSQTLNSGLTRDSAGEIHDDSGFITINVYYGGTFAPELLTPEFSAGGLVQVMGSMQVSAASPQDFSRPVQYTVIHPADPLLRRDYWVQANLIQDAAAYAVITEFSFLPGDNAGLKDELKGRIDQATGKITVFAPIGSGVTARVMYPCFTAAGLVSVGGAAQTSGASGQMFGGPVTYTVVSANGLNRRDYIVDVRELTSTIYVNQNAFGAGDGTNWENAFRFLETACEAAARFPIDIPVEIWIASGTYMPGNSADDSFPLAPNTSYIGGFGGWETAKSQRNLASNTTLISGNLGGGVYSKRLFAADTELGGNLAFENLSFTGARGAASGGSGIHALSAADAETELRDCSFNGLETGPAGAAVYALGGGAVISNSVFNACEGGAVYVKGTGVKINDTAFSGITGGDAITLDCTGETEITLVSVADYSGNAIYLAGNGGKTLETINMSRGQNGLNVQNTAGNLRADGIELQTLSGSGVSLNNANGIKYLSGITARGITGAAVNCLNAASGLFTLTGGDFDNTGAISVSGASVTVLNTAITNSKAASALDITANENTVIDAVTVDGVANGRGLNLATNGSAAISNTRIRNCTTTANGGGMYISGSGSAGISNLTITGCRAGSYGGGMYLACSGEVFISNNNAAVIDNAGLSASNAYGGGIYRSGGSLRVENSVIKNISGSGANCAGIYHTGSSDLVINGLELQNIPGYGIYNNGGGVKNLSGITGVTGINGAYGVYSTGMTSGSFTLADSKFNSCAVYSSASGAVTMQVTGTDLLNAPGDNGLYLASGGVITVNWLTVDGVPAGRGINIAANGSAAVSNTVIKNCVTSGNGGGVYVSGSGSANITYTTITGCKAASSGGGMYLNCAGNVVVTNTTIDNAGLTASNASGGGVYRSGGSLRVENSVIKNISGSGANCAGIFQSGSADLVINGLELQNIPGYGIYSNGGGVKNLSNITAVTGISGAYGVYSTGMASGSFTLAGGKFRGCAVECVASGAVPVKVMDTDIFNAPGDNGLYTQSGSGVITIEGVNIDGVPNGRGMRLSTAGNLIISDSTIRNCKTTSGRTMESDGAGLAVYKSGTIRISGTAIENCEIGYYAYGGGNGGGIYFADAYNDLKISNSAIRNCKGATIGGGVYIREGVTTEFSGLTIENCKADAYGGGVSIGAQIYSAYAYNDLKISNSTIRNCKSDIDGGGVYIEEVVTTEFSGLTIENCEAEYRGGGIYLRGGERIDFLDLTMKLCLANRSSGAIGINSYNDDCVTNISNSRFINCSSGDGVKLVSYYTNTIFRNCEFTHDAALPNLARNTTYGTTDTTYLFSGASSGTFENCTFTNLRGNMPAGQNYLFNTWWEYPSAYGGTGNGERVSGTNLTLRNCTFNFNSGSAGLLALFGGQTGSTPYPPDYLLMDGNTINDNGGQRPLMWFHNAAGSTAGTFQFKANNVYNGNMLNNQASLNSLASGSNNVIRLVGGAAPVIVP
ncbi:MAG: right-handed parallel beta-helix repeat-containing protein [Treponema sp.]|jgi:hypothetical protein|nr:right-handed parallel beta-helix repeat-containing protein [Treponema sp.]